MLTNKYTTQQIIDAIPNPLIITDDGEVEMCNKNFLEFFNFDSIDEFLEKHECVCELFQEKENYFSLSTIDDDTVWTDYIYNKGSNVKVSILSKNNNSYIFNLSIEKINDSNLIIFTNITAKQESLALKTLAYIDFLTQIYNRQMFDRLYLKELEKQKRHGEALSLIMLDIDYFKALNDTYGHDIGDKVLITLSKLISKNLRAYDIFARWGGEEFMILLLRTDKETAYDKAEELRKIIEEHNNQIPRITVSFGVTELTDYDKDLSAFVRVDKALYKAKIKRNDVVQL